MHFYYFMNLKGKKSEYNFEYKCRRQPISSEDIYSYTSVQFSSVHSLSCV